jgi:uncharacterized protein (TIGR03083 family)
MKPVEPITTVELFPPLSVELINLLRGLSPDDWEKPTTCELWSVKDVAAHLLGGSLGRLSTDREETAPSERLIMTCGELVTLIDEENATWVEAAKRINPELLIEFLRLADERLYQYFKTLKDDELARIPVAWAGLSESPNWFDIAREYTEKWLHQAHIREAVGKPLLSERRWLYPVLDTFMRALPYTYRETDATDGTLVSFVIEGEAGGEWSLLRQNGMWNLYSSSDPTAGSIVHLDQDLAWRLFTRGIIPRVALPQIHIEGDKSLGVRIMNMVAIMA